MIVNWSRISQFQDCRRKAYNWDALRLISWREADPLITGGGFHVGAATLFSTKDPVQAVAVAEKDMRDRYATQLVLDEERPFIEQQIEWTKRAVLAFAENYEVSEVQVLWPEVNFCVPIPDSWHHCWFVHLQLHHEIPYDTCPGERMFRDTGRDDEAVREHFKYLEKYNLPKPACFTPHYFKGKTDAVVQWRGMVWLFEHKTNSQTPELFYRRFLLDAQATGYMYGIWKAVGVRPSGFILNVIQKPYRNAKDQLAVGFGREAYLRSDEDLTRFISELKTQADDYERAFMRAANGDLTAVYMNTSSCTKYSRQCYYMDFCQRHFVANPDEFRPRDRDYVEEEYEERFKLVQITQP